MYIEMLLHYKQNSTDNSILFQKYKSFVEFLKV